MDKIKNVLKSAEPLEMINGVYINLQSQIDALSPMIEAQGNDLVKCIVMTCAMYELLKSKGVFSQVEFDNATKQAAQDLRDSVESTEETVGDLEGIEL